MIEEEIGNIILERVEMECEFTASDVANDPILNP